MTRAFLLLLLLLPAGLEAAVQACDPSPIVIRNVNVWTRRGLIANRDVFVRDGRIAAIQPSGGAVGGDVRMLDGKGHTLLPGLVDAHLHFSVPGGLPKASRGG